MVTAHIPAEKPSSGPSSITLGRLLASFLKIGSIGFGGGMAVIALMEEEFVRKRRLIAGEEFVHGVGLAQILGPFAVNTSFFIGYRLFGVLGGLPLGQRVPGAVRGPSNSSISSLFSLSLNSGITGRCHRARSGCDCPT